MALSIKVFGTEARLAVAIAKARRGLSLGAEPDTVGSSVCRSAAVNDTNNLRFTAIAISFAIAERCLVFDASFFALSCFIVAHLLCPEPLQAV